MLNTVKSLLESSVEPEVDFFTQNRAALNMLESVAESERMSTRFTPQKVMVLKSPEGGYLLEYANNLERFMLDNDMGIKEAMLVVSEVNEIPVDECTVIFDESCVDRIDIGAVIKLDTDFDVKKM